MMRSRLVGLTLAVGAMVWCNRVGAQGDVLFPGATVQGDILRGLGVKYKGQAVLYLNSAKARSIDADTLMRFNQYVYESLKEYNRERAARLAGKAAGRNANLAAVQLRLREHPTDADVAGGDALNALLVDLSDPRISPSVWAKAKVPLPAGVAKEVPFQYAPAGGTFSLEGLTGGDSWPVALRYKALEPERRAYGQAVATLLEQCRRRQLTPEAVEAVGSAAHALGTRAEAVIPARSRDYRSEARRYVATLERSARALTRSTYIEDLLAELDGFRGESVGDLLDLMRRYNVHFGPVDDPVGRRLYLALYALLRDQVAALGPAVPRVADTPAEAAAPAGVDAEPPIQWVPVREMGMQQVALPKIRSWSIRGPEITCTGGEDVFLRSSREYSDFVLTMEFFLPPRCNTGVYIRCPGQGKPSSDGMEVQLLDDDTFRGPGFGPALATGGIWGVVGPRRPAARAGRWNALEVRCRGERVQVVTNGVVTADVVMDRNPKLQGRPRSGYIGLSNLGGKSTGARFRHIHIRPL